MRQALIAVLVMSCGVLLGGCGAGVGAIAVGGSLATYVNTGKLPTDHLASEATTEDCNIRHVANGKKYCQTVVDPKMQALQQAEKEPYCYRTLGGVACYDQPDPYVNNQLPVR